MRWQGLGVGWIGRDMLICFYLPRTRAAGRFASAAGKRCAVRAFKAARDLFHAPCMFSPTSSSSLRYRALASIILVRSLAGVAETMATSALTWSSSWNTCRSGASGTIVHVKRVISSSMYRPSSRSPVSAAVLPGSAGTTMPPMASRSSATVRRL